MKVELIDHMGDDLRVANAARVSFAKESEMEIIVTSSPHFPDKWKVGMEVEYVRSEPWGPDKGHRGTICEVQKEDAHKAASEDQVFWVRVGNGIYCTTPDDVKLPGSSTTPTIEQQLSDKDAKLIHYLAKHGHWSPFSHCFLTFRIKAPIFVARQLQKHQVGLSWNEVSRRYVDSEPEFYVPEGWRKRSENVKQGSSDELSKDNEDWVREYKYSIDHALELYRDMINCGVCPEQARMVLPQSMYTEWYWSGSLYAFSRVCKQRLDSHAQKETQQIARFLSYACEKHYPVSWDALMQH